MSYRVLETFVPHAQVGLEAIGLRKPPPFAPFVRVRHLFPHWPSSESETEPSGIGNFTKYESEPRLGAD